MSFPNDHFEDHGHDTDEDEVMPRLRQNIFDQIVITYDKIVKVFLSK